MFINKKIRKYDYSNFMVGVTSDNYISIVQGYLFNPQLF